MRLNPILRVACVRQLLITDRDGCLVVRGIWGQIARAPLTENWHRKSLEQA